MHEPQKGIIAHTKDMSHPYLIIGGIAGSVASKTSLVGQSFGRKLLESKPDNWRKIIELLEEPNLSAVIVTLTARNYEQIDSREYASVASVLLQRISAVPHLVLIHEAVFGGAKSMMAREDESWDGVTWNETAARQHFGDIDESLRLRVNEQITKAGIKPIAYKRNMEGAEIASGFLDDQQRNLMFRIYIPSGKLFEEESSEMLGLFHDWLLQVRGRNIRRGGYQTANGRVIEFFAEDSGVQNTWSGELETFAKFLSLIEDTKTATAMIQNLGLNHSEASILVSRYSKKFRRLQLDSRQEHERIAQLISADLIARGLQMRHAMESDLLDRAPETSSREIENVVAQLIPSAPDIIALPAHLQHPPQPTLHINQQIFNEVKEVVAHQINGDVFSSSIPAEFLSLIQMHGDGESQLLVNAAQELADSNAPINRRITAKQILKTFTLKIADRVTDVGIAVGQKWLEQQMGLGGL